MPDFTIDFLNVTDKLPSTMKGYAIIDAPNATVKLAKKQIVTTWTNIFNKCKNLDLVPFIIGKTANEARFRRELDGVNMPYFLYAFLHGPNETCPDDQLIHELHNHIIANNMICKVFTNDKYRERENWVYNKTMISWYDAPIRPRHMYNSNTWIYEPNKDLIMKLVIADSDKINIIRP
jgi:hypothetical protein